MADGFCMKIARPGHHQNVLILSQTAIQHDTLISLATGSSTSVTHTDVMAELAVRS